MPVDRSYAEAARKYSTERPSILFVAEAPPNDIHRYFYFETVMRDDWLWVALMKALYRSEWNPRDAQCPPNKYTKTQRQRKTYWLQKFRDDRFRLIDAFEGPIVGNHRERVRLIQASAGHLIAQIKQINPKQIILIKATVHDALFEKLREAKLPVVNEEPLPFPSSGQQLHFHERFCKLLDSKALTLGN